MHVAHKLQPAPASLRGAIADAAATPRRLRTMVDNLIEAWPPEVYTEPLVEGRLFGRKTVYVCDPALIRDLLVEQADALEREDFMIRSLAPALGRGILTSDGARWRDQRRTVAPAFRHDRIKAFVPAMAAATAATRGRWRATGGGALDMLDEMMRTTFDIIVSTMIPEASGIDVERFGRAMTGYLDQASWKIALTVLGAPHWTPHPGCVRAMLAARYLRATIAEIIENRIRSGETSSDLLGLLLAGHDREGCPAMQGEALVDNLLTFVAAGHETTALVMAWTFRLLAEHPDIADRLLREIAHAPAGADPASADAYPYARQVLMEAMRLYPPAPLIVRRTIRNIELGGVVIPAGRSVHVPVFALHRHRGLWPSPDDFDPDRFGPGAKPDRDRYGYLPFGAGPRICIGMAFAMTECVTILVGLLPAFEFACRTPRPDARFKVTLRPHGGMPISVQPRAAH